MAQKLAQKKNTFGDCNTRIVPIRPPSKARNWVFTLNNYTQKDIGTFFDTKFNLNLKQFCFQEEKGENGTPHLQGVLAYTNAISFNTVKKISPNSHWEICRNLKKALQYCSKADTRNGKTFTWNYKIFNEGRPLTKEDISKHILDEWKKEKFNTNL